MKTVILASGKSARLLPLTKNTHQCLLKVNNVTILEHQLNLIYDAGLSNVVVICGYYAEKVEAFCNYLKIGTLFNPFYDVSGQALTLWSAKDILKDGFIMLFSDILFSSNVLEGLLQSEDDICLAIRTGDIRNEGEKSIIDNDIITKIVKNSMSTENTEFIGIAKFTKAGALKFIEALEAIARSNLSAFFFEVINQMISQGDIIKFYNIGNSKYVDIDFPDDLKKAEGFFP